MLTALKARTRTSLLRLTEEDKVARWRQLGAKIGEDVFVGFDAAIDEGFAPLLTIEDGVVISARTLILLHDSAFNNVAGLPIKVGPVTIKSQAYIGVNSTILCGVTVGRRAVVGAGAVVAKDIPDEMVAFGCPATVRGTVAEFCARFELAMAQPGAFHYWDILPWRDRRREMTEEEVQAAQQAFMRRFTDQGHR